MGEVRTGAALRAFRKPGPFLTLARLAALRAAAVVMLESAPRSKARRDLARALAWIDHEIERRQASRKTREMSQ